MNRTHRQPIAGIFDSRDHLAWAEYWGFECLHAIASAVEGKDIALNTEHAVRCARAAWSRVCRAKNYRYWDARFTANPMKTQISDRYLNHYRYIRVDRSEVFAGAYEMMWECRYCGKRIKRNTAGAQSHLAKHVRERTGGLR